MDKYLIIYQYETAYMKMPAIRNDILTTDVLSETVINEFKAEHSRMHEYVWRGYDGDTIPTSKYPEIVILNIIKLEG